MNRRRLPAAFAAAISIISASGMGMTPASAVAVSVLQGSTYRTAIFPNDMLTVADSGNLTGKRVNLREGIDYPACDSTNYSLCDGLYMLNKLDGFDTQPRVAIPFSGAIDVTSVNDSDVFIQGPGGRTQLMQLVWDPALNTLSGISNALLQERSEYVIVVTSGVKDTAGNPVDACGGACVVPFTTRSASAILEGIRRSLDDGSSYAAAGLSDVADRRLSFHQGPTDTVFTAASVQPSVASPANGIVRLNQTTVNPADLTSSVAPNLIPNGFAGKFAFGSFESPRYQYRSGGLHEDVLAANTDGVIPALPTKVTPLPYGHDTLGVILILPNGTPPAGGWPVAIYGPGFTRSKFDIFVTADYNALLGVATIATDPAGHGYGTNSQVTVTHDLNVATTFLTYGRGRDLDGDGCIGDGLFDGVGPTDHRTNVSGPDCDHLTFDAAPSHKTVDGLQSGLMQTVVDNMELVRSLEAGITDPAVGDVLSHEKVYYYGLSFGGIYGTMLMGTDTHLSVGLLNVPGGPIVDIARLSGFRGNLQYTLGVAKPNLLNGGPGLNGFTESLGLRQDPPVTAPVPGAIQLQETFASTNWYDRSGSPETFAPLMRLRPLEGAPEKKLLFQTAYGDATVPNPTAGNLYRDGQMFDLVTYFRHDKSAPGLQQSDPHGWLADPTIDPVARTAGEQQLGIWLQSGGTQRVNTNPVVLEVPATTIGNFDCLHYPDPGTGVAYSAPSYPTDSRECPTIPQDLNGGWVDPVSIPEVTRNGTTTLSGVPGAGGLPNTGAGPMAPLATALTVLFGLVALRVLLASRRALQSLR
ncbi:MAG: hypothetical protein QOE92_2050 [Chloroflexota bacterium]|jgi:hypothetical protein|nr:hypothetical protein [Chloroflexota bacterium]